MSTYIPNIYTYIYTCICIGYITGVIKTLTNCAQPATSEQNKTL